MARCLATTFAAFSTARIRRTVSRSSHAQGGRERLPGYDLTFRAPKSVSLLFALGEGEVSRDIKLAHEAAVRAALGYLEREAAFGRRRGEAGMVPVRGEGFMAAAFQHRTSRAGDPLLHHHVLVANLVRDGARTVGRAGRAAHLHARQDRRLPVPDGTARPAEPSSRLALDARGARHGGGEGHLR